MTKSWLNKKGIPFTVIDATADDNIADSIRAIAAADGMDGRPTMPYVQYSTGDPETDFHWFGFIPDNLDRYATTLLQKAA